jgi:hypothetical protein
MNITDIDNVRSQLEIVAPNAGAHSSNLYFSSFIHFHIPYEGILNTYKCTSHEEVSRSIEI